MALKNFEQLYSLSGDQILPKVQVVNNLTSTDATKPLAAAQGKVIKTWIDEYNNNKGDGGYATLDENGKIYTEQLPSYVDDVVEFARKVTSNINVTTQSLSSEPDEIVYSTVKKTFLALKNTTYYTNWSRSNNFPGGSDYGTIGASGVTPAKHKIFVCVGSTNFIFPGDTNVNKAFRWGGTDLVEISSSMALGEVSGTAYDGGKGKSTTDKVNKIISTSAWLESMADPEYSANNVTLRINRKSYDANGNQILNNTSDINELTLNAATTTAAGLMSASDKAKLNSAPVVNNVYTKTESDGKYSIKANTGKSLSVTGNSDVDGVYLSLKSETGVNLSEIQVPVASITDENTSGLITSAEKKKLSEIQAITTAELNTILV